MKNYKIKIEFEEYVIKDEAKKNDIKIIASKGEKGDPGPTGPQGEVGPQGPIGLTGPKGDTGPQGPKGNDGSPGPQGERGLQGEKGDKGDKGDQGIQGVQGLKGDKGDTGSQGPKGDDGYTPVKGVDYFTASDIASLNIPTKVSDLTNDSGFISQEIDPIYSSSVASGITSNDVSNWNAKSTFSGDYDDLTNKPTLFSGSYDDLTDKPTIPPTMSILKYGISTWNDFITAYTTSSIVYCRASSNSNPASGSQTRMAFMAYVNNETSPTEVEFQYYRSVATHSDSQQGDQVFVYKLNKTNGWSVLTRNAFTKIVAGTGLKSSYSNGVLTISLQ